MSDKVWLWLARRMPRKLRYWATIVAGTEAALRGGVNEEVPAMLFVDVLARMRK